MRCNGEMDHKSEQKEDNKRFSYGTAQLQQMEYNKEK